MLTESMLLSLTHMLKLRASEHSSRAIETRPGVSMTLQDNRLQPEAVTLQQRVELQIWHPDGMQGLHDDNHYRSERTIRRNRQSVEEGEDEVMADNLRPQH